MTENHHAVEITVGSEITGEMDVGKTDEIINHLEDCAENHEGLDIYQFAAFRCTVNTQPRTPYYVSALKSCLALCTQLFAMGVILCDAMMPEFRRLIEDPRTYLKGQPDKPVEVRMLSILLLCVIIVFSVQSFKTFSRTGMYRINPRDLRNKPDFVNSCWITIGRYANITVLFMVMLGSMFLIFTEVDPILIVLKSSALFFVLRLDDMFGGTADYQDLEKFLKSYHHRKDHKMSKCGEFVHRMGYSVAVMLFWVAVSTSLLFVVVITMAGSGPK